MKKPIMGAMLLSTTVACVLFALPAVSYASTCTEEHTYNDGVCEKCGHLLGDMNGNNKINIVDDQIIYDLSCNAYTGSNASDLMALADVTGGEGGRPDGVVDAQDARAVQYAMMNGGWEADCEEGHSWNDWVTNGDATEETDGTKTRTCRLCSAIETVNEDGSALGDDIHSGDIVDEDYISEGTLSYSGDTTEEGTGEGASYSDENDLDVLSTSSTSSTSSAKLPSATTISEGWYNLQTKLSSNQYLDMSGSSLESGGLAEIYTKNGADAQLWKIQKAKYANGIQYYTIMSGVSGYVLDCTNGNTANGTAIQQWPYNGTNAQLWSVRKQSDGSYTFVNKGSGRVLDVKNGSSAAGTKIHLYDYNASAAQKWILKKASKPSLTLVTSITSGWYNINSYVDGELLDVSGNSTDNFANVQIWGSTGATCQKWRIVKVSGQKYYRIFCGRSYECGGSEVLDCLNGGKTAGTNIQQYQSNNTSAQYWYIYKRASGAYVFKNVKSGLVMDVSGGQTCANVQLWNYNYTKAQDWYLTSTSAPAKQSTTTTPSNQSSAGSTPTPYSGAAQQSMTGEELIEAKAIFEAYNNYRASQGLNRVAWSDDCCNMAFGSVSGCAAIKNLTHRLGIPSAVQLNYSDILLYSTWQMDANEAVTRWAQSSGHRKMMKCPTATVAGVACYNDKGTWYYAIVYNFSGCNQIIE